jgi:RNA polymerase sigma-70 factor (ECF subfamily)
VTTDPAWIEDAIVGARPQAIAALLRHFRDLDLAEEAFQEASLRALQNWPRHGAPRDPVAWLIFVARNSAVDQLRRSNRHDPLPDEDVFVDPGQSESRLVETLDHADYRDDLLRLMFICCHPDLPATQQIALSLRIVSGIPVTRIARAFLVSESALEQRITRAKARIAAAEVPFEAPGPIERAERLAPVATMIYLLFNEGYSAGPADAEERRALSEEAIRLARLLLRVFPAEPELMGLLALMLIQHSRVTARFDADGQLVLLEDQDRTLWDRELIDEAFVLLDKALRHRRTGPFLLQAGIAAMHARAPGFADTDWQAIDRLYATLETVQPSPVVTLNRAVAISKLKGVEAALEMLEPLAKPLDGYFYFYGVRGALLRDAGRNSEAREAFERAIALANSPAEAAHIRQHLDALARNLP